jgi:hypothetical protein
MLRVELFRAQWGRRDTSTAIADVDSVRFRRYPVRFMFVFYRGQKMSEPNYKDLSRGVSNDMSPEAIDRRLEIASQLWKLANVLGQNEYVGKIDAPEAQTEEGTEHEPPR